MAGRPARFGMAWPERQTGIPWPECPSLTASAVKHQETIGEPCGYLATSHGTGARADARERGARVIERKGISTACLPVPRKGGDDPATPPGDEPGGRCLNEGCGANSGGAIKHSRARRGAEHGTTTFVAEQSPEEGEQARSLVRGSAVNGGQGETGGMQGVVHVTAPFIVVGTRGMALAPGDSLQRLLSTLLEIQFHNKI